MARCMTPWLSLCQWPSVRKCCPTGFFQKISDMTFFSFGGRSTKPHVVEDPKSSFIQVILADWRRAVYWPIVRKRLFVSCYPPNWQFLTLFVSKFFAALQQYSPTLLSICRTMCVLYVLQQCSTVILVWCE